MESERQDGGVIWLRKERGTRGPRPAYTRKEIVAAAIKIADADGIDAVTMRRVADSIGAGTMSLYRYVDKKHDILELMYDAVQAELHLPELPTGDWRAELHEVAQRTRELSLRHPWLVTVGGTGWTYGPNVLRYLEYVLTSLDKAGMSMSLMLECVKLINNFVEAFVVEEMREKSLGERTGLTEQQRWESQEPYIRQIIDSGEYPMFARAISEGDYVEADVRFRRGLDLVLDGIAVALERENG